MPCIGLDWIVICQHFSRFRSQNRLLARLENERPVLLGHLAVPAFLVLLVTKIGEVRVDDGLADDRRLRTYMTQAQLCSLIARRDQAGSLRVLPKDLIATVL